MKTIFKYDVKIQQTFILLFVVIVFAGIISGENFFFGLIVIVFFLLATVQYTLNVLKFFNNNYLNTDSRKAYLFISTYVVISFFTSIGLAALNINALQSIVKTMVISWLIVSPVLIIQSLLISYFDEKNQKAADMNISAHIDYL
jgi:hypothetical protein